jgi:hypothetical protein
MRQTTLLMEWGFQCTCELCILDAADGHSRRASLIETRHERAKGNPVALKALVKDVEATYAKGRTFKPDIAKVYHSLVDCKQLGIVERFNVSGLGR